MHAQRSGPAASRTSPASSASRRSRFALPLCGSPGSQCLVVMRITHRAGQWSCAALRRCCARRPAAAPTRRCPRPWRVVEAHLSNTRGGSRVEVCTRVGRGDVASRPVVLYADSWPRACPRPVHAALRATRARSSGSTRCVARCTARLTAAQNTLCSATRAVYRPRGAARSGAAWHPARGRAARGHMRGHVPRVRAARARGAEGTRPARGVPRHDPRRSVRGGEDLPSAWPRCRRRCARRRC